MNLATIEIGDAAVEIFITWCANRSWKCRKASEFEDKMYGYDVVVTMENGIEIFVDVKNRSHNICGRLVFETGKFYGRKPFAPGTWATHIFVADEEKLISVPEYFESFVLFRETAPTLRRIITEMEHTDFKRVLSSKKQGELTRKMMEFKVQFQNILRPPWEFVFDSFVYEDHPRLEKGKQWFRVYKDDENLSIIDYNADHMVCAFLPTGRSSPLTHSKINKMTDSLSDASNMLSINENIDHNLAILKAASDKHLNKKDKE